MEEILKVKNITKNFGSIRAVSNIDFHLNKGEIVGLIGPNGAGKSTFLNIISGILQPDNGKIFFKGEDITNIKPYKICRKGIVKTSQIIQPLTKLTVFENIYIASIFGGNIAAKKATEFCEKILKFTNLEKIKMKKSNELSLPERKRLEFARALATKPEIILLDENMSGLSSGEIDEALKLIKNINKMGITIVVVEHIMKVIKNLCSRIVVFNYGEKIADGTLEQVFNDSRVEKAYFG